MTNSTLLSAATCVALVLSIAPASCATPPEKPSRPDYHPPRPAPAASVGARRTPEPAAVEAPAEPVAAGTGEAAERASSEEPGQAESAQAESEAAEPAKVAAEDLVIATVDGQPVMVSELLRHWMTVESRQAQGFFSMIVDDHVAKVEAERMGIRLDPDRIDDAVVDFRMQIEDKLEKQEPKLDFEQYVRYRLGLSPETYLAGIRRSQERGLLLELVVRTWILTQEHARVRVIIVRGEELGDKVQAALDAGREFGEVASELSEDPSAGDGGLMPPIIRSEQLLLSRLAFSTAAGEITGPVEDGDSLLWLQVLGFPTPLAGSWSVIEPSILASLDERPLDELEFQLWRSFVAVNHEVDPTPFLRLMEDPPKSP